MKKIFALTIAIAVVVTFWGCNSNRAKESNGNNIASISTKSHLPLNISVYLDLSDRLVRDLTPSQMDRDTAIINNLVDLFIDDCIKNGKILNSNNHFQIFFYPTPNNNQIAQFAKGLNVDLAKTDMKDKKVRLVEMKRKFSEYLTQIYNDAIIQKNWVGSDIWGFFSNRTVDKLCIRNGYRNVLVILTDGYIFHADNKMANGKEYSYVLPQTLVVPGSSLMVKRDDLKNLEVLMLEVNPYDKKHQEVLESVIEKWFENMGIEKFGVSATDLPVNTEIYIESFIND